MRYSKEELQRIADDVVRLATKKYVRGSAIRNSLLASLKRIKTCLISAVKEELKIDITRKEAAEIQKLINDEGVEVYIDYGDIHRENIYELARAIYDEMMLKGQISFEEAEKKAKEVEDKHIYLYFPPQEIQKAIDIAEFKYITKDNAESF